MLIISWSGVLWSKESIQNHIKMHPDRLNEVDAEHKTLLWEAVFMGCTEVVQMLLEAGASADIPDHKGRIPLLEAALIGNAELVRILVPYTHNIHTPDEKGRTALSTASRFSHVPGYENIQQHLLLGSFWPSTI